MRVKSISKSADGILPAAISRKFFINSGESFSKRK
jgi:hypothetical protein